MRLYLIIFFCFNAASLFSQNGTDILGTLDRLDYSDELPEEILSSKALVLVKVPNHSENPKVRGDWEKLSDEIQPGFQKAGIDGVAYYYIDDVFSGPEVVSQFADLFEKRELTHVIFVIQENQSYQIIIAKITSKDNLITAGQDAYKITGDDLARMTHDLYLKAASSGLDRTNLLIIEVPIYGDMAKAIKGGRRGEHFDVNFSSEKLAVPAFADTSQISRVMEKYPYRYEIVDPTTSPKQLRDQGFQYVLYYVHTVGKKVKEILEYPTTETETAYISEVVGNGTPKVKSINVNTPVYKFYIKHIYSEKVFLGTRWDADTTWWDALDNYVSNLKNQLVRD